MHRRGWGRATTKPVPVAQARSRPAPGASMRPGTAADIPRQDTRLQDFMDPLVIAFGLGVGILVGLTGIGGGSLMTPLLLIFIGTNPVVAVGTDLAYGAITKTLGGWRHLRSGTVDLGVSKWLALGSVPGSIAGVLLVDALHDRYGNGFDTTLLSIVAAALFIVAFSVLARALFGDPRERNSVTLTRAAKAGAVGIGLVLGVVLGMTSVG